MTTQVPTISFNYRIVRKKRKSLGLYVKDNTIEARAPYWLRDQEILLFLHSKTSWCEEQLAQQAVRVTEAPTFDHNTHCLFFGETRSIQHHTGKPCVVEQDSVLHVYHPKTTTADKNHCSEYLRKWMRKEAEQYLRERCYELEAICRPPKAISAVQFRKTKSKWGHCSSKGEIQLNWLLIMAPPEVMDYVIIHEICHLTHMNHSPTYWQLVSKLCPEFKAHKQWLADHGHRISF